MDCMTELVKQGFELVALKQSKLFRRLEEVTDDKNGGIVSLDTVVEPLSLGQYLNSRCLTPLVSPLGRQNQKLRGNELTG